MSGNQVVLDATREKLIEAAGEVFAEFGFEAATVREICSRAGANVAAVNYHFGDKLGLYSEVLSSAMLAQQEAGLRRSMEFPEDPQAALAALIQNWLDRSREGGRPAWFMRIMAHEMTSPTPGLERLADAMRANYLRFRTLVGKLTGRGPDDSHTRMCVHSIVGQILQYVQSRPMLERLWPELDLNDPKQRRAIADHITEFSLAGIERVATRRSAASKRH